MNHNERDFTIGIFVLAGCVASTAGWGMGPQRGVTMPLELKSPDFISGGIIPKQFTCDGSDMSPALQWNDPPGVTPSFALIADRVGGMEIREEVYAQASESGALLGQTPARRRGFHLKEWVAFRGEGAHTRRSPSAFTRNDPFVLS